MGFCSVRWCGKTSKTSSYTKDGITFHRFPKCPTRKEKWIDATHRGDMWFPKKTSVICSRHFPSDCFYQMNHRRRLLESAIPTIHIPMFTQNPADATSPALELHAHDLDESACGDQVCGSTPQDIHTTTVQVLEKMYTGTGAEKIHDSTEQDPLGPSTSEQQRNLLQAPPIRKRTVPSESYSEFDCPIKRRLCRRIEELKNVINEKNIKLRKLRDANRKLKRRIISLTAGRENKK